MDKYYIIENRELNYIDVIDTKKGIQSITISAKDRFGQSKSDSISIKIIHLENEKGVLLEISHGE